MDTIATATVLVASIVSGLGLFAVVAVRWGVDSRPTIGDDHAR